MKSLRDRLPEEFREEVEELLEEAYEDGYDHARLKASLHYRRCPEVAVTDWLDENFRNGKGENE